jgi:hypothetical protein
MNKSLLIKQDNSVYKIDEQSILRSWSKSDEDCETNNEEPGLLS